MPSNRPDRVIVSSTDDYYLSFLPVVRTAYQRFLDMDITIALLTDKDMSIENSYIFMPINSIPIRNQAKMVRYFLAMQFPEEVCMFNDADLVPLNSKFLDEWLPRRTPGKLMAVGGNYYKKTEFEGRFNAQHYLTAEGHVFSEILNPNNLSWENYLKQYVDCSEKYCDIGKEKFSDEMLLRHLVKKWSGYQDRIMYVDYNFKRSSSRCFWATKDVLQIGLFDEVHLNRPFCDADNKDTIEFIMGEKSVCN